MAKKTEFDRAKDRIVYLARKREEMEDALAEINLQINSLATYMWTMDEAKDEDGELLKIIDLGDIRVERRVRPYYDAFLFEGECAEEFADLRAKHSKKAFDNYSPTQTEMEATYKIRKDGDELRRRHLVENKIVFAIAKNPQ